MVSPVAFLIALWLRQQQLQRLETLQERSVALAAAVAASGSVAGELRGLTCNIPDRDAVSPVAFLIVLWLQQQQQLQRLEALQESYVVSPAAFLIATWSHL